MNDKFINEIESEVNQAIYRQTQMNRRIEILQAEAIVVGEYASKFMDLRDKFKKQIEENEKKSQEEKTV